MTSTQPGLHAEVGDRLIVRGHHQGEPKQDGEVIKVLGDEGGPPFIVRWEDGHKSEVFPGSDTFVQHLGTPEDS
jgi:hypothetical protein